MSTPRKCRKSKPLVTSLKWDPDVIVGVAHKPLKLGDLVSVTQTIDGYPTVTVRPPTLAERVEKALAAKVQADAVATQRALVKAERDAAKERKTKEAFLTKLFGREDGQAIISSVNDDIYTVCGYTFRITRVTEPQPYACTGWANPPKPGLYLTPHGHNRVFAFIDTLAGLGEWIKRHENQLKIDEKPQRVWYQADISAPSPKLPWYRRLRNWLNDMGHSCSCS